MTLGKTIQTARNEKKLSATSVASKIIGARGKPLAQSLISQIERDEVIPSPTILHQLCSILDLIYEDLMKTAIELRVEEYRNRITTKYIDRVDE